MIKLSELSKEYKVQTNGQYYKIVERSREYIQQVDAEYKSIDSYAYYGTWYNCDELAVCTKASELNGKFPISLARVVVFDNLEAANAQKEWLEQREMDKQKELEIINGNWSDA